MQVAVGNMSLTSFSFASSAVSLPASLYHRKVRCNPSKKLFKNVRPFLAADRVYFRVPQGPIRLKHSHHLSYLPRLAKCYVFQRCIFFNDPRGVPKLSEEVSQTSIFGSDVNDLVSGSSPLAARTFDLSLFWLLCPEATWGA